MPDEVIASVETPPPATPAPAPAAPTPAPAETPAPVTPAAPLSRRDVLAQAHGQAPPASSRLYDEFIYAAQSWSRPWRVVLKAEVMSAGDNPRFGSRT